MAQFDPAAATQAYLAVLSPEAHAKATAYTQGGHWVLLWAALVTALTAWIVLKTGILVKVRNGIESKKSRPWLAVAAVVVVDAVIEGLLTLPWSAYADWWRQKSYGLTDQAFGGWLGETLTMMVISMVMTLLLASGVYALMRRAPKTWWAWGGGLVAVAFMGIMVISPVFIEPLFNTYTPAPAGPVRDTVVTMANANGVPSDKIYVYNGSKQSNRYTANVSGLFGTARVAMSDTMFKQGADIAEVKGVVGHEMGHYVHMHAIWLASAFGLLALGLFFVVDRLFAPVARLVGAKDVTGIADPAGLPVIYIIIAVVGLLATPITSSISRLAETDADKFSLERFNEPDGLAKALVKTIEYRAATPSRLEEVMFYDHPAVGSRVRMAMDWKAAHPPKSEPIY
ncbi:M48 family metallopeptidase [Phenylobacterium sp.]|uniref:M48 family metallopeptidase n=1 Tax=Phenylobacterium sp. TaxID=1871053 RepID=UPI0030F44A33